MKRPIGLTVISIVAIIYGVLDIVNFLVFEPTVTGKRIEYSIPFLGIVFLISGIGTLAQKQWAMMGMIIGCMLAMFYSGQDIYHGGLPREILFLHIFFIILYGLVIFYVARQKIAMKFKKISVGLPEGDAYLKGESTTEINQSPKVTAQCYYHSQREAIGVCNYCGRHLCSECLNSTGSCINESDCLRYQSGEYSTSESFDSPSMFEDTKAIPEEEMDIIGDYGETLDALAEEKSGKLLHPLSKLPHPKEKIANALRTALGIVESQEMRNHLETVLLALEDFVPDTEVPEGPDENIKAWLSRKDWTNPRARALLVGTLTRLFIEKYGENAEEKVKEFLMNLKAQKHD